MIDTSKLRNLGKKTAAIYPSKTTINLVPEKEKVAFTPPLIAATIIGAILVLLFAKFAVIDVLGAVTKANSELSQKNAELSALIKSNEDYTELRMLGGMAIEEQAFPDRLDILTLISNTVGKRTDVQSVSVKGTNMEIQFVNAKLADVVNVVSALESSTLVSNVEMETSKTNTTSGVISTVKVTLAGAPTSTTSSSSGSTSSSSSASSSKGVRNG